MHSNEKLNLVRTFISEEYRKIQLLLEASGFSRANFKTIFQKLLFFLRVISFLVVFGFRSPSNFSSFLKMKIFEKFVLKPTFLNLCQRLHLNLKLRISCLCSEIFIVFLHSPNLWEIVNCRNSCKLNSHKISKWLLLLRCALKCRPWTNALIRFKF